MPDAYVVTCWNCLGEYDAQAAVWCSDDPKSPTKLCPFCLRCACDASPSYKQKFWRNAPQQLVDDLQTLTHSHDHVGDILIRMKKLTTPQLLEALVEQRESGRKLGEVLLASGRVSQADLDAALHAQNTMRLKDTRTGDDNLPYWQSHPDAVLDYLLGLAARKRASDLTFEPEEDQVSIRFRIDGFSFRVEPVPRAYEPALERAMFALFGLDPARRGRPQTGRTSMRIGNEDFDLILQTLPGTHGLQSTIKLVNRSTFIKDFGALGLELEDRVRLVEQIRSGVGLVLVTAPPNNGAITTAYAIMAYLAQARKDILSIESPIHWRMDGVRQVEIAPGVDEREMEATLRAMVAIRPDAVMLSIVPDDRTGLLAANLASSLLMVVQTAASSAARGLVVLRDVGVPPQLLSGALGLALGQRLVRTICRICRVPAEPPPAQTLAAHGIESHEASEMVFFKGKGCPTCNSIGYRGRRAIFETLPATAEVRAAIESEGSARQIQQAGIESGMITMRERCLALVREGVTTFDEFSRLRL